MGWTYNHATGEFKGDVPSRAKIPVRQVADTDESYVRKIEVAIKKAIAVDFSDDVTLDFWGR